MRERVNRVARMRAEGAVPLGLVVQLGSPDVVEMAGISNYDYVWIDCEHGSFGIETVVGMFRAADAVGICPYLRVPSHEPSFIMRALDAGAMGIIVPNVETPDQAQAIVAAAKYRTGGNAGMRGACPGTRAAWHQAGDWLRFVRWSNEATSLWLIVESPVGVRNFEEIVQVPGVDGIVIGSFDLAQAMGFDGDITKVEVQREVARMAELSARYGRELIGNMFAPTPQQLALDGARWVEAGATILSVGSDRRMFVNALMSRSRALSDLKLEAEVRRPPPAIETVSAELTEALRKRS